MVNGSSQIGKLVPGDGAPASDPLVTWTQQVTESSVVTFSAATMNQNKIVGTLHEIPFLMINLFFSISRANQIPQHQGHIWF